MCYQHQLCPIGTLHHNAISLYWICAIGSSDFRLAFLGLGFPSEAILVGVADLWSMYGRNRSTNSSKNFSTAWPITPTSDEACNEISWEISIYVVFKFHKQIIITIYFHCMASDHAGAPDVVSTPQFLRRKKINNSWLVIKYLLLAMTKTQLIFKWARFLFINNASILTLPHTYIVLQLSPTNKP